MGTGLIWLTSGVTTYIGGAMVAYRHRYTKLYKNWKRWVAEEPDGTYSWPGEYSMNYKRRKDIDFHRYVWTVQDHTPACILAFLWPFYAPSKMVKSYLRPEIKIPDYEKIKELENE